MNRRTEENIFVPSDCGPDLLACSPYTLDIPLTGVQKLILALTGASRSPQRKLELEPEQASVLKSLTGCNHDPVMLWLPPGTDISTNEHGCTISFEAPVTLLLAIAGRRSGKTTIGSILMSWLARMVLKNRNYLDGVPILPESVVSILNLACDTHQAKILFRMLTDNLGKLGLIKPGASGSERVRIGRLLLESLSSSAKSARGRTACGVCLDEFAHFQRNTDGPLTDRAVWTAVMPSLATFGDRGLGVVTTTPAGKSGVVWELFRQRGIREGMLTIQAPTWVMNPNVGRDQLEEEFVSDEFLARQEYGAEFLEREGEFIRESEIRKCVRVISGEAPRDAKRHIHVDIGLSKDSTAIVSGYLEKLNDGKGKVVIDVIDVLQGSREDQVSLAEIEKRIKAIAGKSIRTSVTFDQFQSSYVVERLKVSGLDASVVHTSRKTNWEAYRYLRDLIRSEGISIPDHERTIKELVSLVCDPTHDYPKVEAPSGGHDDCADAVAMCALCLGSGEKSDWVDFFNVVEGV